MWAASVRFVHSQVCTYIYSILQWNHMLVGVAMQYIAYVLVHFLIKL